MKPNTPFLLSFFLRAQARYLIIKATDIVFSGLLLWLARHNSYLDL